MFTGAADLGAGAAFDVLPFNTVAPAPPAFRVAKIESDIDVNINTMAEIVVAFDSSVAEPRGPNAVCEPIPPKAPAKSAALPLWSNTTIIKKMQTSTCTVVSRIIITALLV